MSAALQEFTDSLVIDGTKVGYWPERIAAWQRGERIAPITIDVAMTRACNAACIGPDELILMFDGSHKRMADVATGDRVVSLKDGEISQSIVTNSWLTKKHANTMSIVTSDGVLRCTADHRIWTNDGWREAGRLRVGDEIITISAAEKSNQRSWKDVEGQEAASIDGRREGRQATKELGVLEQSGSRCAQGEEKVGTDCLQPRSRANKEKAFGGNAQETWREIDSIESDAGAFSGRARSGFDSHERAKEIRRVPAWADDGGREGISSSEDDWKHDWRWTDDERRESTSRKPAHEGIESSTYPRREGENSGNAPQAAWGQLLFRAFQTIVVRGKGWAARSFFRSGAASNTRANDDKQPNDQCGRSRTGRRKDTGAEKEGVRQNEADVGRRENRAADVSGEGERQSCEQNGADGNSDSGKIQWSIRRRWEYVASDHDQLDSEESGFHFWEREGQDGPTGSWDVLASGRSEGRGGNVGLLECRVASVHHVDEEYLQMDVAGHPIRNRVVAKRVLAIRDAGTSAVYDLECYPHHNFVASGVVVHNCSFCYASLQSSSGEEGKITEKNFFDFLDDAAFIGVKGVSFISDGESTVVPWWADAVEHAASVGLAIGVGSNGIKLTKPILERTLKHISYLRFNFSAGEKARYAQIMGVKQENYDIVVQNIKDAMEIVHRDKLMVGVNMQLVCDPKDRDQLIPFAELVARIKPVYGTIKHCADDKEGHLGVDYSKYAELEKTFDRCEEIGREAHVRIEVKRGRMDGIRRYTKCFGPPFITQVSGNGLVAPCGFMFNEKWKAYHIGNITTARYKDIWASDRYMEVMRYLASDNFDPSKRCGANCLQHNTNDYLFRLVNGRVSLPTTTAPAQLQFI